VDRIRKITTEGVIQTVANQTYNVGAWDPHTLAADDQGNVYVTQHHSLNGPYDSILKIDPQGNITTYAGREGSGERLAGDGGHALGAQLHPLDVTVDARGNTYLLDDNWVRKIDPDGRISTIAQFNAQGVTADAQGNLYIADTGNNRIRKVDTDGTIQIIAGNGTAAFSGDGGPATQASLKGPRDVALDGQGNLYIADSENFRVRKVTPEGVISTVAGTGYSTTPVVGITIGKSYGDGGPATQAGLAYPTSVEMDSKGNLYIADSEKEIITQICDKRSCADKRHWYGSHQIRRVDRLGTISTVAGAGNPKKEDDVYIIPNSYGDNGPALAAFLGHVPTRLTIDSADNLYIAVLHGSAVWKMTPDGTIHMVAGSGGNALYFNAGLGWLITASLLGDGGAANRATLNEPLGIAIDQDGNLLIADTLSQRLREVYALPTTPQPPMLGDVNGDQKVDVQDAILALRAVIGLSSLTSAQRDIADIKWDQQVTIQDVILLLQIAAGLRNGASMHRIQSDDFSQGLAPFWKLGQPRDAYALPNPSFKVNAGKFSLTSADRDVWLDVFEPFAVYQDQLYGDFTMQLKVEQVPACHEVSAAGLLLAQSLPEQIPYPWQIPTWALLQATHADGPEAKWGGGGTSTSSLNLTGIRADLKPPYWVRVDRQGSVISFFISTDGAKSWEPVTDPVDLAKAGYVLKDPIVAGIEEQTHCDTTLGTAWVSHFEAGPLSQAGHLPGD
jgi:hypothetical protein